MWKQSGVGPPNWMNENTIDFLWRHSARPNAQAHRVDQVLMNINDNLMKEQKKEVKKGKLEADCGEK